MDAHHHNEGGDMTAIGLALFVVGFIWFVSVVDYDRRGMTLQEGLSAAMVAVGATLIFAGIVVLVYRVMP